MINSDISNRDKFQDTTEILNIYSGDRNILASPSPNKYSIKLIDVVGKTYKNVKSVRLLSGVLPDVSDISQQPFLILNVDEFNLGMTGTNTYLQSGSSILQMDRSVTTGFFFNLKTDINKCIFHVFSQPIAELSRISISITDPQGNLFNFGTDTGEIDTTIQHLLCFEIVCQSPVFQDYNNVR